MGFQPALYNSTFFPFGGSSSAESVPKCAHSELADCLTSGIAARSFLIITDQPPSRRETLL